MEDIRRETMAGSSRVFDIVRDNAIPAAMIGVGMYLLLRSRDDDDATAFNTSASFDTYRSSFDQPSSGLTDKASGAMDAVSEGAHHAADFARSGARKAATQTRGIVNDKPLVAGVAALAFGAIVGALIPETNKEHELLGAKRDELADKARQAVRDGVSKARDMASSVASSAATAATDAAKNAVKSATSQKTDVGQNVGVGGKTEL